METLLIKQGDENVNIDINLTLQELKALYNLLKEEDEAMIGYKRIMAKIEHTIIHNSKQSQ